jgi:hypothetical protein
VGAASSFVLKGSMADPISTVVASRLLRRTSRICNVGKGAVETAVASKASASRRMRYCAHGVMTKRRAASRCRSSSTPIRSESQRSARTSRALA